MPIIQPSANLRFEVVREAAQVQNDYGMDVWPIPDQKALADVATPEHVAVAVRAVNLYRRLAAKGFHGEYFCDPDEESLVLTTGHGLDGNADEALTQKRKQRSGKLLQVELFTTLTASTLAHDISCYSHMIIGREVLAVFESYRPEEAVITEFGNVAFVGPMNADWISPDPGLVGNLAYAPSKAQLADLQETLDFIESAAVASGMKPETEEAPVAANSVPAVS